MNVNSFIIKWYLSFLTNRVQHVKLNKATSDPRSISWLTSYMWNCQMIPPFLAHDTETRIHHFTIQKVNSLWTDIKTEDMIFDPKSIGDESPVIVRNVPINQVVSYKYLGVHIDSPLTWHVHVDNLCSKIQQRMYFLRRLRLYGVNSKLMFLFYQMILESVIRYVSDMACKYGTCTCQHS